MEKAINIIILAAGKGSRMKSGLPKVLQPLAGKPLLAHVIDAASSIDNAQLHIVIGHGAEQIKQAFPDTDVNWVLQAEQLGTGHAVKMALDKLNKDSISLVLYGDVPLVSQQTLKQLIRLVEKKELCLLTVSLENPSGYGRVIRDNGNVIAIVEEKDATEQQRKITECNTGIMAMKASLLHELIPRLDNDNSQGEYYLTDLVSHAVKQGKTVEGLVLENPDEVKGINDKNQLAELERYYQMLKADTLMKNGVTLVDPARIDVRGELDTGMDVYIDINCVFQGKVQLGNNVHIGPNCIIGEPGQTVTIGDNTEIKSNSVIEQACVGNNCVIGPFARLRPGTVLSDDVKIGNFVETKKSMIGKESKVNHLTYIGDSEIGNGVNIGAGTITCNYDGANKHKTIIGDNAFVGSNTSIVAPVTIKAGATIAAGSTVTKDVEEKELAIARSKQKNIKGWPRPTKK